jgi:hypothetical protein
MMRVISSASSLTTGIYTVVFALPASVPQCGDGSAHASRMGRTFASARPADKVRHCSDACCGRDLPFCAKIVVIAAQKALMTAPALGVAPFTREPDDPTMPMPPPCTDAA